MIFVHQPGFSEVVLCLDLASLLQVSDGQHQLVACAML